jgi:ATP-binding protein involved in chromosome partitioning
MSQVSEAVILESLKQIIDPDLRKDIVTLGFIRDLKIAGGDVAFRIVLTTPACRLRKRWRARPTRSSAVSMV